ncbi:GntR family transcriptional regulator [Nocardioides sp. zg-DK7169]|uniref:GntR family transcriptional regulator n=1 Tax=Nocardioides sp. zg-DK7169 TaxID=2736600 RepID=UPI001555F85A|nr:GntR family transcriptional regulator [Nocardioides sp. zg-DK7169]NPC98003.1 GntR family transcriptional regulator [Nocardioides sp. zg-DK7169]
MGSVTREHGSLRENVVAALRADIIHGRLEPGEPLRTEAIMQRFGVSNSPLREAFAQLASEGLVVVQRNRGASVAPLSRAGAHDVLRLGALFLEHVLRWGVPGYTPGDVAALRRTSLDFELAYRSGDVATAYAEADRFGAALLERCGSPELAHAFRALLPQLQRLVRLLDPFGYLALQGSLQSAVVAAAADRDAESAVTAARSVWRQVTRAVEDLGDDHFGA